MNRVLTSLKRFSPRRIAPSDRPVLYLAAVFFAIMVLVGLNRYFSFFASYDQGIFNQVFWNNLHGRFFQSSLSSVLSSAVVHDNQAPAVYYHRLGQHFTPALLLWLPFYALYPAAETLVVIQVGLITLGGLMLYVLARHYLPSTQSWLITAAYYGANAVIGPTFSNFHDLCQIPLFVFSLLLALERRIWWLVWLMAFLLLTVREDAGITLFGLGFYFLASRRFPKLGMAFCAIGFGAVVVTSSVLMPLFSEDVSRRFAIERFGQYAGGNDEASMLQILWAIITQPGALLSTVFGSPHIKLFYIFIQVLPLAFIPLRSPSAWAIAGFPFMQLLIQRGQSPLGLHIRYAITLVPGLFYGAVLWWAQRSDRFQQKFQRFWKGCIVLSLVIAFCYSPNDAFYFIFPTSYQPWVYVSLTRQWEHAGQINRLIDRMPPDASVTATTYVIPHVSNRRQVLRAPFLEFRNDQKQTQPVDYILLDLWQLERYSVVFRGERNNLRTLVALIKKLKNQNQYGIVELSDRVILLQRKASTPPELASAWSSLRQEYEQLLKSYDSKK